MSNIDADDHGLAFRYNTEFLVIQELISSTKFQVEFQRHIGEILVVPILGKFGTDDADVSKTQFDVTYELDAVVDGCINIGQDHKK